VKPASFDYLAARSIDEATAALQAPGARVLAGGQSLVLEMVYRETRPATVVDINAVPGLDTVRTVDGALHIGATVRHADLERADPTAAVPRLLARAAPYVAHPPIRARGTFCGSVAWAHPSAEWNAITAALAGTVHLLSAGGQRSVPAALWYLGDRQTARRPDELVAGVSLPVLAGPAGVGFAEHRRTHASFASVAVAVALEAEDGVVRAAHVGLAGVSPTPVRAAHVEDALRGRPVADAAEVAASALERPGADHRAAVSVELLRRAVREAAGELR
jgi:aerobic carbon-monoxide dehydrogenase medium subunit